MNLRSDALQIFGKALAAADAAQAVKRHLIRAGTALHFRGGESDLTSYQHVYLLAAGKAAAGMAAAIESLLGDVLTEALVVTKHGHAGGELARATILETGHPIPDEAGRRAAERVRDFVARCGERDLLLVAISGGASALLPAPASPITLADKQETTALLLRAGANIQQLNAVRKHISFLKGGRLAALAHPAATVALLLSDVIGDPLDVIGSGPTTPDDSTFADALRALDEFGLRERVPQSVRKYIESGVAGLIAETPKAGDPIFSRVHNVVIGSNRLALEAGAEEARRLGYRVEILSAPIEGEARNAAVQCVDRLRAMARPACLLAGGETTVTVRGPGKGGRNQEFALAAAIAMDGLKDVALLSAGTDGTDGPTDAAGAIATGGTVLRARLAGMLAQQYLDANDSYTFFDKLGDLVRTGPTGTNVMDVCVLLAGNQAADS